jgi:catechol 2,3-dioxygenase-like lactoylglutathione lyase family enzyme
MTEGEVGIVTDDAARLVAFYRAGLGFEVDAVHTFARGTVHRLRRGQARCKLFEPSMVTVDRAAADPWYRARGTSYAALLVEDADAEVARARAAGAEILEEVAAHRQGARYALLRDPAGNVWEILEEGGARL